MSPPHSVASRAVAVMRIIMLALIVAALIATLTDSSGLVPDSYIDLAGYYTLQANVAALAVWGGATVVWVRGSTPPQWLEPARVFVAANLVLVACVYWWQVAPLGLEDGPQLVAVMVISHIVTPLYVVVEHLLVGTHRPHDLRLLPWLVAYPALWTMIAATRALLGGWVPYEYLNPARGIAAVAWTVALQGIVLAAFTWAALRIRCWRAIADPAAYAADLRTGSIEPSRSDASHWDFSRAARIDITPHSPMSSTYPTNGKNSSGTRSMGDIT